MVGLNYAVILKDEFMQGCNKAGLAYQHWSSRRF